MPGAKRKLAVVGPDDLASEAKRPVGTILEAAQKDDLLGELLAMRERLAKALDDPNTSPRDLASLSIRQIQISKEVAALKARESKEAADSDATDEEFDAEAI